MDRIQVDNCTILKVITGSRAYGFATPDSDIDIRGVCIPPKEYYYSIMKRFEQIEYKSEIDDVVIFGVTKFFKLAMDNNPSIMELLWVDNPEHILFLNKWGKEIRANRKEFLSMKCKHTYSGYAYEQMARINRHRRWLLNPPSEPTHYIESREEEYKKAMSEWDQYNNWKQERNPKRAELEAKYGYDCYSVDTLFLTDSGWKSFGEISEKDKLATVFWNNTNLKMSHKREMCIEYQNYINKFSANYTGYMYNLVGYHVDVNVTPNHRLFVNPTEETSKKTYGWSLIQSDKVPSRFLILNTINPIIRNFKQVILPINWKIYMQIMGLYISEGTVQKRNNREISRISISQIEGGKACRRMSCLINKYKNEILIREYKYFRKGRNEIIWTICNNNISNKIAIECGVGSKNKHIPRWVFGLSKRVKKMLINSMIDGDGTIKKHKKKNNTIIYYTSSKQLANDVNELSFLCGYESSVYGPYHHNMYHVYINKNPEKTRKLLSRQNIKKTFVKNQQIVCFTVPNGILVTRRNGMIGIHGNSKHACHLVRLLRTGYEILSEGQVRVNRLEVDAQELSGIKNGEWSYEQLVGYSEDMNNKIQELYDHPEKCAVPFKPNIEKLDELHQETVSNYHKTGGLE